MRTLTLPVIVLIGLMLLAPALVAEEAKPAAPPPGIFGEFTLVGGEQVIGLYHPEQGTLQVYGPAKVRTVKAKDVVATRRLAPEPEIEPVTLDAGNARVRTLATLFDEARRIVKRTEYHNAELQKARQSVQLERSKREEGNKVAEEAMSNEQDPARKAAFAALSTEHLKAIAAANAAIVGLDADLAACEARLEAALAHSVDIKARMDWLLGRLAPMARKAEEKKAKR